MVNGDKATKEWERKKEGTLGRKKKDNFAQATNSPLQKRKTKIRERKGIRDGKPFKHAVYPLLFENNIFI